MCCYKQKCCRIGLESLDTSAKHGQSPESVETHSCSGGAKLALALASFRIRLEGCAPEFSLSIENSPGRMEKMMSRSVKGKGAD